MTVCPPPEPPKPPPEPGLPPPSRGFPNSRLNMARAPASARRRGARPASPRALSLSLRGRRRTFGGEPPPGDGRSAAARPEEGWRRGETADWSAGREPGGGRVDGAGRGSGRGPRVASPPTTVSRGDTAVPCRGVLGGRGAEGRRAWPGLPTDGGWLECWSSPNRPQAPLGEDAPRLAPLPGPGGPPRAAGGGPGPGPGPAPVGSGACPTCRAPAAPAAPAEPLRPRPPSALARPRLEPRGAAGPVAEVWQVSGGRRPGRSRLDFATTVTVILDHRPQRSRITCHHRSGTHPTRTWPEERQGARGCCIASPEVLALCGLAPGGPGWRRPRRSRQPRRGRGRRRRRRKKGGGREGKAKGTRVPSSPPLTDRSTVGRADSAAVCVAPRQRRTRERGSTSSETDSPSAGRRTENRGRLLLEDKAGQRLLAADTLEKAINPSRKGSGAAISATAERARKVCGSASIVRFVTLR